jgi:predicted transcriptional regulator
MQGLYVLSSASSVQSATKKLLEKDIITEIGKVYSLTDKLFAMWINGIYGDKFII